MTRARNSANLASHGNLFVDIANDRTGIGSVAPAQNLHVAGTAGFHADVTFTGDAYNAIWDRSHNCMKFLDNAVAKFGTNDDLNLYHASDNSYVDHTGTGHLFIRGNGTNGVLIRPKAGENSIVALSDAEVQLWHNNLKKFETTAYGTNTTGTAVNDGLVVAGVATVTTMNVTGVLTYDDVTSVDSVGIVTARQGIHIDDSIVHIGDTNTKIRFPSADTISFETGGSQRLKISSSGNVTANSENSVMGVDDTNAIRVGLFKQAGKYPGIAAANNAPIAFYHSNATNIASPSSQTYTERFRIASDGAATFAGNVTISGNLSVTGTTTQNNSVSTSQKTITLASGAANNAAVDGAGIVVDAGSDTDKTLKWLDSTDRWTFTGGDVSANAYYGSGANLTGIDTDLVSDTSPQLGGTLDVNGQVISFDDATGVNVNRAKFGTGNDLHIYHNGSNSTIRHEGTGSLLLTTVSGSIQLLNGSENMLIANPNGGVQLYYDNSIKLETISTGIRMQNSSELTVNGGTIQFGHSSSSDDRLKFGANGTDLQIFHGGNGQFDVNTGDVIIRNTGDFSSSREIYLMARVDEQSVTCYSDGGVELYYNNGRQLQTLSNGIKPDNNLFMNDNKPIYIGNGLDLQIYHDGSNSFIKDGIGSSGLVVQAPLFAVKSADGSENMIVATQNGNVELMHNNTKMLETLNEGIKVHTGSSSTVIRINSNTNVESIIQGYNSDLLIKSPSSGNITLYANGTESAVNCIANGAVELYHNGNRQVFTFDGGLNWQDTKKAEFGNSGDLKIYHNGSNSAVQNYQGALYISNKETNSSDLHLQGKDSIQMHCPSDGTIVQKIDNNRLTTFDVGAPSSSNKTIARFQSESSRKLDVVWHDSGSYMGFDTPGNHPYMFKVNGSSALEINTYREVKTEESSHGWSTYEMHAKDGGTRFHYRGIGAGSSGTTINLIRVRRHYWGSGWYHIKLRQRYYNGSAEGHWWLHGHGRNTGGHSPSWQLNHTNHNNLGGSKVQITSNSNSSPGNDYSGYVDVYANIGAYEYYEVVIETSLMSGYNHGVANVGNDSYALHAF